MGYVYKITNTVNNKSYIGITIYEPTQGRIKDHLSGSGQGNRLIARDVKKYGKEVFTYEVLEENVFDEILPDLEVAYIANLNTVAPHGYNLNSGGYHAKHSAQTRFQMSESRKGKKNSFYGKRHSEKARRKMSLAAKGRTPPNLGKTLSMEQRREISKRQIGKKRPPFTPEHRRALSKAAKSRKFTPEHRRALSKAKLSSSYYPAHNFFLSLPSDMSLREKRKLLYAKFPNENDGKIQRWVRKWTS